MTDKRDFNLLEYNTFGISETCRRFISFNTIEELLDALRRLTADDMPVMVIGKGSNLLLTQRFEGTVLHSDIRGMEAEEDGDSVLLRCGSGETWDDVVAHAVEQGWYGAENLSLIPGDVGASAVQNIGAYGSEAKDIIECVEAVNIKTLERKVFANDECGYSYRQSVFKNELKGRFVITHVTYRLNKKFVPHLEYGNIHCELQRRGIFSPSATDVRNVVIDIRNAKLPDPAVLGNAGSFFMNPVVPMAVYNSIKERYPDMPHYAVSEEYEKIPAGWLIEQCGWKGRSLGRAGVHERQALVLVNRGGATGKEIVTLCETIRYDVKEKFGLEIFPEVNIIGGLY